jgi:hypothetical protein
LRIVDLHNSVILDKLHLQDTYRQGIVTRISLMVIPAFT